LAEKGRSLEVYEKKNPRRTGGLAWKLEREKGFESQIDPGFSRAYETIDGDNRGSTERSDASRRVPTSPDAGDTREDPAALPSPTPEMFITAGAILAERAARERAEPSTVQEILRRAMDQAAALRPEAAR
jgi:hypothetical protein